MKNSGTFIMKNFKDKIIEIFTGNEQEYVHYSDTDMFSWSIVVGKVLDYDKDAGVLTLESMVSKKKFYINEFKIELFWESGFNILETTKATIDGGKQIKVKYRDIM